MAALTCAACGTAQPDPAPPLCGGCGADLTAAGALIDPAAPRPAPAPAPPAPAGCAVAGCARPAVGAGRPRGEDLCAVHLAGRLGGRGFRLRAPWGVLVVPAGGEVGLGRDPAFSPCAGWLAGETRVSGRHALLRSAEGRLVLVDQGARNHTRVNGALVAAGEEVPLVAGDRVRLGGQVELRVEG